MQNEGTRYVRVEVVAEMFDVSKTTIYRAIRSGQLDAVRIGGSVRVPESALVGFVERAAADAHAVYVVAGGAPEAEDMPAAPAVVGAGAVVGEVR